MKKLTVRLSQNSVNSLQKYKMIFDIKHKPISYNSLINLLIFFKIPYINISDTYLNYFREYKKKLRMLHSSDYYKKYITKVVKLTNAVNCYDRKYAGAFSNINQIAKDVNVSRDVNYYQISDMRRDLLLIIKGTGLLRKEVLKAWQ